MSMIHRRALITGLVSLIAAPAIVRAGSLMPVKHMWVDTFARDAFGSFDERYERFVRQWMAAQRAMASDIANNLYQPYGEPSFPITTPRQIRT